jgi:cysteine desulfurase/selenocysteine lyase
MTWNVDKVRQDFPVFGVEARGKPLVYLDNAATTLKPRQVVAAVEQHFLLGAANVHRGVHFLSEKATRQFDKTRESCRAYINAASTSEIIFTTGTTFGINLIAHAYGRNFLKAGDEILISHMEHHSNIVPWQMLCQERGTVLKVAPINDRGEIIVEEFQKLLSPRTKIVSTVFVSNALGTINPIKELITLARTHGADDLIYMVDSAQAIAHIPIDVQTLGADFLMFSGHKLFAPTGVGVLWGRKALLEKMPPFLGGGDMIRSVTFEKTTYADPPMKFEAGTPDIGGVIGLGAALEYVKSLGVESIAANEKEQLDYAQPRLADIPGLRLLGTAAHKVAIVSFVLDDVHPHDIGSLLDAEGIAVRAGHHCTQPLMARFKVPATARASFSMYNKKEEVDVLVAALHKVKRLFA